MELLVDITKSTYMGFMYSWYYKHYSANGTDSLHSHSWLDLTSLGVFSSRPAEGSSLTGKYHMPAYSSKHLSWGEMRQLLLLCQYIKHLCSHGLTKSWMSGWNFCCPHLPTLARCASCCKSLLGCKWTHTSHWLLLVLIFYSLEFLYPSVTLLPNAL